jgi:catecholate siderophore receptor
MSRRQGLKTTVSRAAMMAGVAMTLPGGASAQGTGTTPAGAVVLPTIDVQGAAPANTLQRGTSISRLPGSVQDTPQTINVIPREVLEQQNVTTLEEALRNVPGITVSTGEGNGGVNGDQFRIRGFSAQNDIYIDGLRDFGAYQRDAFTYEDVSVIKGPSGFALGTGSVGGAVAVGSRLPHLGNSYGGTATGGSGPYARGTIDVNQQIGASSAIRLNLMGQSNRPVDRDASTGTRWGFAPSIAFGLGTDTTVTLEYLHYQYDLATDAGVPVITPAGSSIGRPITEFGLPRSTFYGTENDRDKVQVDRLTASVTHRPNDWLSVTNDLRVGFYDRDFAYTLPSCDAACTTSFLRGGNPTFAASGAGNPFSQSSWSVQDVLSATAKFSTGPLRHELTGGIDVWREEIERSGYGYSDTRPPTPINSNSRAIVRTINPAATNKRTTDTSAFGAFLSERVWLIPELSIIGGVRWTRYQVDYAAGTPGAALTTDINSDVNTVDPRAAIVFEPNESQTYYASYSTSSTPPGSYFATQPGTVGGFRQNLDPEKNTIYELGAKISVLDRNRLGLYGAIYQIEKDNAVETDPTSLLAVQTSDKQRNRGVEIGVTGQITTAWNINANYTYMDSETTESLTAANVGKRVQYVPENAAALWTTYEINRGDPLNLTVGGGITWRDKIFLNATNTNEAPSNFSLDAIVSHKINDNLRLQVNGYNLTNELNYGAVFTSRAVPTAGRTVLVTLAAEF